MSSAGSVAAIVVTFHPAADVKERVRRYAGFVGRVIVVDNSEPAAFSESDFPSPNIVYLPLASNSGIAHALNVGAHRAVGFGHTSAVLLDQDSELHANALDRALACVRPEHGITALRQSVAGGHRRGGDTKTAAVDVVDTTMTSGSILSLDAFRRCGDFETKLFIDYVDHDYCLRLKDAGFLVVECGAAVLDHTLGEPVTRRTLGVANRFISHRPFRLYYVTRNGLYLVATHARRHPRIVLRVAEVLVKELIKSAFLESEKRKRLGFMARGFADWARSRYGKLGSAT